MWLPPGSIAQGPFRVLMFSGGAMSCPAGVWLAVTAPAGRFTFMGAAIAAMGADLFRFWWSLRPAQLSRAVQQLRHLGCLLGAAATVLLVLSGLLFFLTTSPGDPLAVFAPIIALVLAGLACSAAGTVTALQMRAVARTEAPAVASPVRNGNRNRKRKRKRKRGR